VAECGLAVLKRYVNWQKPKVEREKNEKGVVGDEFAYKKVRNPWKREGGWLLSLSKGYHPPLEPRSVTLLGGTSVATRPPVRPGGLELTLCWVDSP